MTVAESLKSINIYPIPDGTIEKICTDRELTVDDDYDKELGESEGFQLATADTYFFLATNPNIVEQAVGLSFAAEEKKRLMAEADRIYGEYDDPKFSGNNYGFIGEDWNG